MARNTNIAALGTLLSLVLFCSCSSINNSVDDSIRPQLPADVTMNVDAGCGAGLYLTLRLENGLDLLFKVDTGSASSLLVDKSVEPYLGEKCQIKGEIGRWDGSKQNANVYEAPKLYLGGTPLVTAKYILVVDFKQAGFSECVRGRPITGLLGMDCLRHYCIQLDFEARKVRFLDDDHLDVAALGQAFPLAFYGKPQCVPIIEHVSLIGERNDSLLVDSGVNFDGALQPRVYAREVRKKRGVVAHGGVAVFPECVWDGQTYTNLLLISGPACYDGNSIGLAFLARHLVTMDFPRRTIYLKRNHDGLPVDVTFDAAIRFLRDMKGRDSLPGWSKDEIGVGHSGSKQFADAGTVSVTFDFQKNGDSSFYHYTVSQASEASPWKLQKAWRTDEKGAKMEEYPVP